LLNLSIVFADDAEVEKAETTASAPKIVVAIDIELDPSHGSENDSDDEDYEDLEDAEEDTEEAAGDQDGNCAEWASKGECLKNPGFMTKNCAASCRRESEPSTATASVYEGEDAGIGAFRFAEDYGIDEVDRIMTVARALHEKLTADGEEYRAPKEITHCGKRACTAGKLWKRAEEMKKADMHDAAGADYIRSLLKTGIEVDFRESCERSLQWALGSIERQREREKREAAEEARLELRREEERAAVQESLERKKEYEADFSNFGRGLQAALLETAATAHVDADGTVDTDDVAPLIADVMRTFTAQGPQGGDWNATIQSIRKIPMGSKSVEVLLVEARCHEMLGHHKEALSASGSLVKQAASHEPWINDSPRMMAATLGANAAMQLGLSENALSFYQLVLKFDPEQPRARVQYRGLKKVVKLMNKAEEQIQKGYNKVASGIIDDCQLAMRGLDVDSPLFRSKIQLKQCTVLSGMGRHEEALANCDSAVELRVNNAEVVSAASIKEAHLVRGEALLLDMDYDEAVQDFRAAVHLLPENDREFLEERRELEHKLQATMHQQDLWNGGKKDHRYNEHTGYPDGRPPERDQAKILQLPIDLEERDKSIRCAWLKKQFKLLVRKFHPDKYKGNVKRGSRKFKEVTDAKEILAKQWGC